ncbi:RpiB/LacA/LacB family sugar-phosphate isomerase, partial [bacterium]|nr:RpiB/LacA/LacB family sugar-phosphate isomerase [bacterium]
MKIAIGSDHRGFSLKEDLKEYIQKLGFDYKDFGTFSEEKSDYPDSAAEVSLKVSQGHYDRGILICASG